jgi:hypothetical protein
MGKDKTPKKMEVDDDEEEEQQVVLSVIAQPLAKDKLVKKVLKLVKTGECTANRSCTCLFCAADPAAASALPGPPNHPKLRASHAEAYETLLCTAQGIPDSLHSARMASRTISVEASNLGHLCPGSHGDPPEARRALGRALVGGQGRGGPWRFARAARC